MSLPWPEHLDALLPPERVLKGQYRITGFVGEGGSGAVFEGVQDPLARPVAIKVMYPGHHARVRERFLREAQAVAGLRHPNVVTVYDFGLIDHLRPFIVMELLSGCDLAVELQTQGPMSPERALPLFIECLEALAEAHDKNLVHRDLKPDNLFLSRLGPRREALQILDFGIALFTHDLADAPDDPDSTPAASARLTPTGQKVGTPHYLAPEYFESGQVSPAMDIYAMGLVLAEMLTGEPVVQASHFYGCVVQHLTGRLKFPDEILQGPLGPAIRKATARQPQDRYPHAHAFWEALQAIYRPTGLHRAVAQVGGGVSSSALLVAHADTMLAPPPSEAYASTPEGCVLLTPGAFQMGSPDDEPGHGPDEALHEVVLTRPFFLQTHELTQETWATLVPVNPSEHKGPKLPVNRASWFDAVMYANLRSERDGLTPYYAIEGARGRVGADLRADAVTIPDPDGPGWRLPTEAEWEYACRAGSDTLEHPRYGPLREVAWYGANARRGPQPVGQLQPNAWGLYDMLGNVWEWVWDRHAPHMTKKARDPLGPAKGAFRVYRGGCFSSDAAVCRAANRGNALPDRRLPSVGFRLARNLV